MAENLWFLKRLPIFSGLGDESATSVVSHGRERLLAEGTLLNASDQNRDEVFVVLRGQLEVLSYQPDGRRGIVNILEPGDFWGWLDNRGRAEGGEELLTLRATTAVSHMTFSREYFERLLARRPTVAVEVTRMLGLRTRRYEVRLASLIYQSSRQKLASLLLEISHTSPQTSIDLSHDQLGALIGLSREQVTRLLGDFALAGHIRSARRKILVLDREGLRRVRGGAVAPGADPSTA